MAEKYFGGVLPEEKQGGEHDSELIEAAGALRDAYQEQMDKYAFQSAIVEVFKVLARANKYIDETEPWVLAKDETKKPRLAMVLYNLLETIRICTVLLTPFIPDSCKKIFEQIGADSNITTWDSAARFGKLPVLRFCQEGSGHISAYRYGKELAELEKAEEERRNGSSAD